jgi:hypothetical protein
MAQGLHAAGQSHELLSSTSYRGPAHDVAIFYGLALGLRRVLEEYRAAGRKAIYVDMGYWGRRLNDRFDGFHKLALNDRHPTAYFQRWAHPPDRIQHHGIRLKPWRTAGRHILVAGMSAKAAQAEGLPPHSWERATIARLRELTDRPIVYRPKPNWTEACPIEGSVFAQTQPLDSLFNNCHAVVAHHSNVAVDALLAGVPCICPGGVASSLSGHDLTLIESPPMPDGRQQWAQDVAYTQWSIHEMRTGAAWGYLAREVLPL